MDTTTTTATPSRSLSPPPPPSSSSSTGNNRSRNSRRHPKTPKANIPNTLRKAQATLIKTSRHGNLKQAKDSLAALIPLDEQSTKTLFNICFNGDLPIVQAAAHGHLEFVQWLVENGAEKQKRDNKGMTAFLAACSGCHMEVMQYFIKSTESHTLLDTLQSTDKKNQNIIMLIAQATDATPQDNILAAMNYIFTLLDDKPQLQANLVQRRSSSGMTALHFAAQSSSDAVVSYLISKGSLVDKRNDQGFTPIDLAEQSFISIERDDSGGRKRGGRGRGRGGRHSEPPHPRSQEERLTTRANCVYALLDGVGVWKAFSEVRPEFIHSQTLLLRFMSIVGLHRIIREVVDAMNGQNNLILLQTVMKAIASVHKLVFKVGGNTIELWETAINRKDTPSLRDIDVQAIIKILLLSNTPPRVVRSWGILLSLAKHEATSYFSNQVLYTDIALAVRKSGLKMLYALFDGEDDDNDYDEEAQYDRLFGLLDLFLRLCIPNVEKIASSSSSVFTLHEVFTECIKPLSVLWDRTVEALELIEGMIENPQRFAIIIQAKLVMAQVSACLANPSPKTTRNTRNLSSLGNLVQAFGECVSGFRMPNRKKLRYRTMNSLHTFKVLETALAIPTEFEEWVREHKGLINQLLRSDARLLRSNLNQLLRVPEIVSTQRKIEYISSLAETRPGQFVVCLNRLIPEDFLEFVIQQIASAGSRSLSGEMTITFVDEPGLGNGPIREFFELISRELFAILPSSDPRKPFDNLNTPAEAPATSQTKELNSQQQMVMRWLSTVRASMHQKPRSKLSFRKWWPLFELSPNGEYLQIRRVIPTAFKDNEDVNPITVDNSFEDELLRLYRCVGKVFGLALRHEQSLGVPFSIAFWKLILEQEPTWEEYCQDDAEFKRSMSSILKHDFASDPLDLRFEYSTELNINGSIVVEEVELVENGRNMVVNNDNKLEFVKLRSKKAFVGHHTRLLEEIRNGLLEVIFRNTLAIFLPKELGASIRGDDDISVDRLRENTEYDRGYDPSHHVIQDFWAIVGEFDQAQLRQLLLFWSGSSKPPMFGFSSLYSSSEMNTPWTIEPHSGNLSRLPQANTCDRRLVLPEYPSREILHEKLKIAMEFGSLGYDRM